MKKYLISYIGSIEIEAENEDEALEMSDEIYNYGDIDFEPKVEEIKE